MNGVQKKRARLVRSVVGVALPAMVFLSGCPDQCAPAAPTADQAAMPAPAAAPAAAQPAPSAPTTTRAAATTPTTRAAGPTTTRAVAQTPTPPPPSGLMFSEDFVTTSAFYQRFDHGWSGQDPATWPDSSGPVRSWLGDHDAACGNPMETSRTITISRGPAGKEAVFYPCLPGGDPAKGHVMTSVNTAGYNIAWFSPKQYFTNVRRVCWDQNLTDLGGGKFTQVVLVTKADAEKYDDDLGFVGPGFEDPSGPSTSSFPSANTGGAHMFKGSFEIWRGVPGTDGNGGITGELGGGVTTSDKAARYQHCMIDNENGTVTLSQARPDGTTATKTVTGDLPDGEVRVVFEDDTYNADKHFDASERPGPNHPYTWHWDNIQIG
jgi:hypothetical protein